MKPVCLVIGAGAGIGGTVARRFAKEGYHACLCRRTDQDGLEGMVAENLVDLQVEAHNNGAGLAAHAELELPLAIEGQALAGAAASGFQRAFMSKQEEKVNF